MGMLHNPPVLPILVCYLTVLSHDIAGVPRGPGVEAIIQPTIIWKSICSDQVSMRTKSFMALAGTDTTTVFLMAT